MDGYVAPLLDKQEAPLVAIVDTSKIVTQLVESLGEPINLLIDEGFKDRENRIQKQLLEFEKKIEQKLNFLENNACANTDALNRTVTSLEKEIEDIKTPGKLN
jgi:polyhydroxyalkanoate synthesis regulator phasin